MIVVNKPMKLDTEAVPIDPFWGTGNVAEPNMHRIHAYPAKFPAFIATKAIDYAKKNEVETRIIADVFCGCGTTALEAARAGIDFWGCDINPVAAVIAKVKSHKFQPSMLQRYYETILLEYGKLGKDEGLYEKANSRLKYWYDKTHYLQLHNLKRAIEHATPPRSHYRLFFLCAFSNILKRTSWWLGKSIKPQVDPKKKPSDTLETFRRQCEFMLRANEGNHLAGNPKSTIISGDFLNDKLRKPKVDLIVTSPPYVTSYDYADLHQLSALWLDFAQDWRELRAGSIGSRHNGRIGTQRLEELNAAGKLIVGELMAKNRPKAFEVARYFIDMQNVSNSVLSMLNEKGMAIFVIGNTEFKGTQIDNARHLAESMKQSGFKEIRLSKRKITNKQLTPFRDSIGRFTRDASSRNIYAEEFILVGTR